MGSAPEGSREDRVSELETRSIEFINLTTERESIWQKKKKKKRERDNKDNNKRVNISITEISEEREIVELFEKVFEQIMTRFFFNW